MAAQRLAPEVRRQRLVDAALTVFAQQGYDRTELAHVATEAEVQRPLLYHYFADGKPALYAAVVQEAWTRLVAQLEVGVEPDPQRQLPVNLKRYLDLVAADEPAVRVVRESRRVRLPTLDPITSGAATAMAHGIARNQLGAEQPVPAVVAALRGFLGLFEVLLDDWQDGRLTRPELEALVAELLPAIAQAAQRL